MLARVTPALIAAAALAAGCGGSSSAGGTSSPTTTAQSATKHHRRAAPPSRSRPPALAPLPAARPEPISKPQRVPVPILMYHVVSAPPAGTAYPALWVDQALFAAHLRALRVAGYHAVTLKRVWDAWTGRYALPAKPIVISFDDGYLSQYTHAARALRKLGWPGVLNLKVGNIGPGGLTKHMVGAMVAAGWEVDAHTITHPDLTAVGAAQLQHEVAGSRAILRKDFGVPVAFFCYPAGRFDATVEAAVKRAGFLAATTTQGGLAAPGGDADALPRIRVSGGESAAALMSTLRAATVARPKPGVASGD
jgi:peptidoglycan/xylan/chitin deacetylase (PgdA/CDA1 family)